MKRLQWRVPEMELRSILLLLACLFLILYLTYHIHRKQKKQHPLLQKQEPRFNTHITPRHHVQENYQIEQEESKSENILLDDPTQELKSKEPTKTQTESKPIKNNQPTDEIIYLILRAEPNRPYIGYELLQGLLSAGLRFGAMNIFHYYDDHQNGKILFSIASAQEPGTFEITKMGGYSIKGLMAFLRFSQNKDLGKTLDLMIDVAKQITEDLGGQIFDEEKQLLTTDKIEKWRKKISAFERRQVNLDLFE